LYDRQSAARHLRKKRIDLDRIFFAEALHGDSCQFDMKKLLGIMVLVFFGIAVVELFVLRGFLLPQPVQWLEFRTDTFSCQVPAWKQTRIEKDGWQKYVFSGPGQIYLSMRPLDGDPAEWMQYYREKFLHPRFEADIEVFRDGHFLVETLGKNCRRYVYLFSTEDLFFWAEITSRNSTMVTFKEILDRVVGSLEVGGQRPAPGFREDASALNEEILAFSQPPWLIGTMALGVPAAIMVIVLLPVYLLAGKLPEFRGRRPIRSAEDLFAWYKRPGSVKGTVFGLALFEDKLELYSWKRLRLVITPQEGSVSRVPGKEKIRLRKDSVSVVLDLEQPLWWIGEMSSRGFRVE